VSSSTSLARPLLEAVRREGALSADRERAILPRVGPTDFFFVRVTSYNFSMLFFRVCARTLNANHATTEAAYRGDREDDYMCFSPLRRKTSKLEGEEEYSRLVSRNLRDPRQKVMRLTIKIV
jgi:hypothetical protein